MDGQRKAGKGGRDRRLIGSTAVLAASLSIIGGVLYLQHASASKSVQEQHDDVVRRLYEADNSPKAIAQAVEASQERAKFLRGKWESWALKHKGVLARMLRAEPGDQAALADVWAALPKIPSQESEINGRLLRPHGPDIETDAAMGTHFSWEPIGKTLFEANPQNAARLREQARDPHAGGDLAAHQERTRRELQGNYAAMRDVVISNSAILDSPISFRLWASGRVTKVTWAKQSAVVEEKGARVLRKVLVAGPDEQVEPPYAFLTESASEEQR